MGIKIKKISYILLALSFFFLSGINVKADGTANLVLSGSSSVYVGKQVEVVLSLTNIDSVPGGVSGVQGSINYDSSTLKFVKADSLAPFAVSYADVSKKFIGFAVGNNITSASSNLVRFTFETLKTGSTTISLSSYKIVDGKTANLNITPFSKTISILPPPSSNANLASLSASNGSINFSKDTTSYSLNVGSDVSSINILASAEDKGARVSGTGNRNLNYGNNVINIVVTAPAGNTRTYTININRKDDRSTNNNLRSLNVSGYNINPNFNKNTTTYSITVPHNVTGISVDANAEDSKAKVSVTGNNNLIPEKTTNILIKVTAENGSVKTYTLRVRREKDPNKVLATDNNLASLTTNVGVLDPVFNKDITDYKITVATDVTSIVLKATPSDKDYGEVDISGPETLRIGENKFVITVTAENESTKKYTVIVVREGDPNDNPPEENNSESDEPVINSLTLKDIKLKNGSLTKNLQKDIFVYEYKGNKNFDVLEAIPEDENDLVTIKYYDGIYNIILEDKEGNIAIYTLMPKESNILIIVLIAILTLGIGFGIGYTYKNFKKSITEKIDVDRHKKREKSKLK